MCNYLLLCTICFECFSRCGPVWCASNASTDGKKRYIDRHTHAHWWDRWRSLKSRSEGSSRCRVPRCTKKAGEKPAPWGQGVEKVAGGRAAIIQFDLKSYLSNSAIFAHTRGFAYAHTRPVRLCVCTCSSVHSKCAFTPCNWFDRQPVCVCVRVPLPSVARFPVNQQ